MSAPAGKSPGPRFGDFEVDLQEAELRKSGIRIKLQEQPFHILTMLLEHPGQTVTREELRQKLWSADTFVDFDHSLNSSIKKLREALGDDSESPRFIETLHRRGYRFIAPVNGVSPPAVEPRPPERATQARPVKWPAKSVGLGLAVLASVMVLLIVLNVRRLRDRVLGRADAPRIESLAVLPVKNFSGDPAQEFFADGMTDALIAGLAQIKAVKVISRTSVMHYKASSQTAPQIAGELGVDGILEVSMIRSGDRLRLTAQLIDARQDRHLWVNSYERDTRDVLALQGEISQAVAREIRVALTPEESTRLAGKRPVDPEAYEAYLKGMSHWYHLSREHLDTALEYFELALQKDPNYAPAYVGVSNVWGIRADAGFMPPADAGPKARAALAKALQLDDSLAEAHISMAGGLMSDHNWSQVEQEYRRGIELNPNSADGHFMYADFLISMKREADWNREIHRTLELDPFNPFFQCFYGWHLIYLGRYDEAIAQLQRVLATEPDFSSAHMGLWGAYYKKGMYVEALAEAKKFYAVLHDGEVEEALVRGEAEGGYARAMHRGAEILAARSRSTYVPGVRIARLYAHAGDNAEVIRWLGKAYDQRESTLTHLAVACDWDRVRSDQRFQELLRRMNFPAP